MTLAAHTVVKNIVDYANNIFGTFSTVAQSLVASELGKVHSCKLLLCKKTYLVHATALVLVFDMSSGNARHVLSAQM